MKKKGFTLVELLAVIVILVVIVLITIPLVLDSIERSRRGAFGDSVYQAFQEVQTYLVNNNLKEIPEEGIDVKDIDFKNNIFVSGRIILSQSNNLKASNIGDGRYCAIGEKDTLEIYRGECDLSVPGCELKTKEPIGVNGWYGINPTVIMSTTPVKLDHLKYGIGTVENYDHTIKGIDKVGTAEYQTVGDESVTIYCYVQNIGEVRGHNEIYIPIDKTAPVNSDFAYSISGKNLTVVASGEDTESGISKYQFSIDGGATWTEAQSSNTYTFKNLEPIVYDVQVRIYNGTYVEGQKENNIHSDSDVRKVSMAELETPTYSHTPTGWTTSNVDVTVHFNKDGAYLIKPSINVQSDIEATTCSRVYNGEYTCDGEKTNTLEAGVWYRVDSNPTLTFTENGSIIAQVSDGLNYKSASAFNVSNIDRTPPSVSASVSGKSATLTLSDNAQVAGYNVTTSTTTPSSWLTASGTKKTETYTASSAGTYYAHVKDAAGNTSHTTFTILQSAFSYAATPVNANYNATATGGNYNATPVNASYTATATGGNYNATSVNANYTATEHQNANCAKPGGWCSNSYSCVTWGSLCSDGSNPDFTKGYDTVCPCGQWVHYPSTYSCPNGGTLSGTTCVKTDYTCPSGGTLSGTTCLRDTVYSCPNGGTLSGTTCLKTDYTCPSGGTISGTTCLRSTTYSCPNGGTLSGTTCLKTNYTCPNGGTLSGTTCVFN